VSAFEHNVFFLLGYHFFEEGFDHSARQIVGSSLLGGYAQVKWLTDFFLIIFFIA
jgi:hypothetical protein